MNAFDEKLLPWNFSFYYQYHTPNSNFEEIEKCMEEDLASYSQSSLGKKISYIEN